MKTKNRCTNSLTASKARRKINPSAINALIQDKACADYPSTEQVPSADQIAAFTPHPGQPSVLDEIRRERELIGGRS